MISQSGYKDRKKIEKGPFAKARHWAFLLLLFLSICLFPVHDINAEDPYLNQLILTAKEKHLAQKRYWQILLHYKPSLHGVTSLIDDPVFFLAKDGKHNPENELVATLKAFFQPVKADMEHPRCRFVARYEWLKEQLHINEKYLPSPPCRKFHRIFKKVQPRSAVMIFPCSHINSPASMFGHTLINIEGPFKSKLLSYAVNYSAITDETNGLSYAFKGIFGLYKGYFSVLPYYQKIREYNDLERRDIWEYELNLDQDEVRRMFYHIWELQDIYSDYFFFGENCSYNILFLLEAARPSLNLTDQCRPWVIPVDTIRVVKTNNLVKHAYYRPSKATRITHIVSMMPAYEQKIAKKIINNELNPAELSAHGLDISGQKRVLDLAIEIIEYRYLKKKLTRDEYRTRYLSLLKARSKLGPPTKGEKGIPVPVSPDLGHGSNRLDMGIGSISHDFFYELNIRPAYHCLLDPDDGYLTGSQIEFANLCLRHYPNKHRFELYSLDLINIVSLSPRNRFLRPISWKVETGFCQKMFEDKEEHMVYRFNPGGGFAYESPLGLTYFMLESDFQLGGHFHNNICLGFGGSAGILKRVTKRWKIHLWSRKIYHYIDSHQVLSIHLDQDIKINADNSIDLYLSRHKEFGICYSEVKLNWSLFW